MSQDLPDRFHDAGGEMKSLPRRGAPAPFSAHGAAFSQGTAGSELVLPPTRKVALWQLVSPLARRVVDGLPEPIPSAEAVPVWGLVDPDDQTQRYAPAGHASRTQRIHHIGWAPGDQRTALEALAPAAPGAGGPPTCSVGDWVHAQWNPQTGRWEILCPAENVWRFELIESLWPTNDRDRPRSARARLLVFDAAVGRYVVTPVIFRVADFFNHYTADAGTRGYARRMVDACWSIGWEIVALQPSAPSGGGSDPASSDGSDGVACECLASLPSYHWVRFRNVLDDLCDQCHRWEDAFHLPYHDGCEYVLGCFGGQLERDCASLPCEGEPGDTTIVLSYHPATEGHLRVDVTIYVGQVVRAVFSQVIDPGAQDPSNIQGIPNVHSAADRCDWWYATCDIFL